MAAKNYTINFVDPAKSTINVLPNAVAGPRGGNRLTDIDLIGMGHSLWGETVLENFVHMLENFSSDEDIHPITSIPSATSFTVDGDVERAFLAARVFDIWGSDNNDGQYTVQSAVYDDISETTITVASIGSPLPNLVAGGNLGNAGEIGVPNKANQFGATTPVQGQIWYNQTRGQLYVYELIGSPIAGNWKRVGSITFADTEPTSSSEGDLWWETTTYAISSDEYGRNLQINTGGSPEWTRVAENYLPRDGSKVMQGHLDMGSPSVYQIRNLADPTDVATTLPGSITEPNDAVNVGWADDRYVNVTGDTMTGNLDMNNAGWIINPTNPTSDNHVGDRQYNDARYLELLGTNPMEANLDMDTFKIVDHGTTFDYDAPGSAVNTDVPNILSAKDIVGNVVTSGVQTGVSLSFDNTNKEIDVDLTATIRLTGDITSSITNDVSGAFTIATTHAKVHDISEITGTGNIPAITYNGTAYRDSRNDFVGNALKVVFGSTTKYIPSANNSCGCTCTCTCTCTCNCNHSKCAKWG